MEKNRSGLFVYYRWLALLLASGLCLLPLWATVIGGFKSPGELRTNAFRIASRVALRQLRLNRGQRAVVADAGQLGLHRPCDCGVDLAGEFDGSLCPGPSSLCGQEMACQLPGLGTHLPVRHGRLAGLYTGAIWDS
jgi:hypothetical protein